MIILESCSAQVAAQAHADAVAGGWHVTDGWRGAGYGVVCRGAVDSAEAAERAVLAALAGAGLIIDATAPREVLDRLCDDLRHLGRLDHRVGDIGGAGVLTAEETALLQLLLGGTSLGDAARALHLSRRTADRRLASARRALGARTTSEAVVLASRLGLHPAATQGASGTTHQVDGPASAG